MYIDIHTHLTHEKFSADLEQVIQRAKDAQLSAIVVNGLEPASNREILKMAAKHDVIYPALGIYPIDAINKLAQDLPFSVAQFDVDKEIEFIAAQAKAGAIKAVGECGLDGYWVGEETFTEQERVFIKLLDIAMTHDLPIIIHTRKREKRSIEILEHYKPKRVNFHCYGGKVKLALRVAEEHGWHFSIPANARKNQAFTKMLLELPEASILTETDAPFLAPEQGQRNEPCHVVGTIAYLAELRQWPLDKARELVLNNFKRLMD
ncbi:TatD family hydrolase [Pseudobacteriovorax antillogorgiicola]|uniref:TatD DNase family protein n=1 Tax=Pseudobacteriovorax antillogorgiicola TaxID=1513793 RepID=A0A1Y6CIM2_9BACT|nr:TatD family hydrolase [Pseudobacteriovorax antillogorgiicola]TCS48681.1 TatD DNase family protein [Pseudobacteriovorax antillogorgiicola]SMF54886.1 TatD DNase family protein [Pseudobacteriovorax antillogorgiicola]